MANCQRLRSASPRYSGGSFSAVCDGRAFTFGVCRSRRKVLCSLRMDVDVGGLGMPELYSRKTSFKLPAQKFDRVRLAGDPRDVSEPAPPPIAGKCVSF